MSGCLSAGTTAPRMPLGAAVSGGEFTSEQPCWRPPRRPSASRSEQPAAPPSCWPWPRGAGCPGSRTSPGPRCSNCCRRRRCCTTRRTKQHEEKATGKQESPAEKKQLYRTDGESMFCTNIEKPRSPKAVGRAGNETRTTKRGNKKKKKKEKICVGGSDPEFSSTAELLVCFLGLIQVLTLEDGKISSLRFYFKDF